jgi:hypothetical protein
MDPVAGGSPTEIATGAGSQFLSFDSQNVYFVGAYGFTAVLKQPVSAGEPATLIETASITAASISGGAVYWVESDTDPQNPGPPQNVVKSAPGLTIQPPVTTLGIVPRPEPPTAIAAVGATVIVAGVGTEPGIVQVDGGAPTPVGPVSCATLLAATDGVYCAGAPLVFVGLDGTTTQIAFETNNATHLALDEANVYWTNEATSGSVVAAPRNGGANITIAYDDTPIAVAVDDAAVYWSDNGGKLQRVAKNIN